MHFGIIQSLVTSMLSYVSLEKDYIVIKPFNASPTFRLLIKCLTEQLLPNNSFKNEKLGMFSNRYRRMGGGVEVSFWYQHNLSIITPVEHYRLFSLVHFVFPIQIM